MRGNIFFKGLITCFLFYTCNEPFLDINGVYLNGHEISCEEAEDNLIDAESNFSHVTSDDYSELCEAYKNALLESIDACDEADEELIEQLALLGDCDLTSFFQVDFDNATYLATSSKAEIDGHTLHLEAMKSSTGEVFKIVLHDLDVGTFQLGVENSNNQKNVVKYLPDNHTNMVLESTTNGVEPQGVITITEVDYNNMWVSGTFNFTGTGSNGNSKEFTNGVFERIVFTKKDDFFAKVDGVEFVDVDIIPGINNFGIIGFKVVDDNRASITIGVAHDVTIGTYNFATLPEVPSGDYSPTFDDFHRANGTISIITHNPERNLLIGSFQFTAEPVHTGVGTYEVTEGHFCVTYIGS
ncbi:hypothetical protein SAMN04489761_1065 [Tenacibaculum sp. MAR_2009_124]|uniref:DUF6252 family protein n=1 Tax=Tenacibaculum sp. MAR_2009_124 TaxID=1250059 RepID=UPI0008976664|nr:DUF6252 family protein [Tenacibaculum sp. MAR_2009_124]SEB49980.1 hypothetical protein SAMN04489761_1065 [Tenacibaculum sp. MAR_2009_124]